MWLRFKNWFMSKVESMILDYAELMGVYLWGVNIGSKVYSSSDYDCERDIDEGSLDVGWWKASVGSRLYKFVFRRYLNRYASDDNNLVVIMDILKDSFSHCFSGVRVYGYYNKRLIYVVSRIWLEHGSFRLFGFIFFCFRYYWALFFYHISGGWSVNFRQFISHLWSRFESRTYFARAGFVNRINHVLVSGAGRYLSNFVLNYSDSKLVRYGLLHFSLSSGGCVYYYWFFCGFFVVFCRDFDESGDLGQVRFKGFGLCYSRLGLFRQVRSFKSGNFGIGF